MKIAIFASGTGSNAENILKLSTEDSRLNVSVIITDNSRAGVIDVGKKFNIPVKIISLTRKNDESIKDAKLNYEKRIYQELEFYNVELVCLAGHMKILSQWILDKFFDSDLGLSKVINIHPSLLPLFPGKNGYRDAFNANVEESGATIHFVDSGIDTGKIIAQKKFKRLQEDTFEDFKNRGMKVEYSLYTEVLKKILDGKIF